MKKTATRLIFSVLFLFLSAFQVFAYYQGDDLGFLDYVTVNGNEFENYNEYQIVFYPEDLQDGRVVIQGLLESERKDIPVDELSVEISMDGGDSWHRAKGSSRWTFQFSPEIEKAYDFSIRVVRAAGDNQEYHLWQLGQFQLRTAAAMQSDGLSGEGFIPLGWLAPFLPERLLDSAGDALKAQFENLQTQGNRIVGGSVTVDTKTTLDLPRIGELELNSITFSPTGVALDGALSVAFAGMTLSDLSLTGLNLDLKGLSGDFMVADGTSPYTLELVKGTYGITLQLDTLTLHIATGDELPVEIKELSGSVKFGSGYGNLEVPDLKLLADNAIGWGQGAIAEGQQAATDAVSAVSQEGEAVATQVADAAAGLTLTLPGTDFRFTNIGGSIHLVDKTISLSGRFQFPYSLGGGSVRLPAATPLILSKRGISTAGTLQFDAGSLPALDLSGFPTRLTALTLDIVNNVPSGTLGGQVTLTNFANLPLNVAADIDKKGLKSLRAAVETEGGSETFSVADFATLTLTKLALGYDDGAFSVELDGAITPTNSLISSMAGIGDSLSFHGLKIAQGAITLADNMSGWHDLTGASAEIEGAVLTLTQYGVGVEENKFWVGLKGTGALAGAQVTATARVFHDGTTELSGIDLDKLYLAFGEFSLKVDRSAVNAEGLINSAQGAISGIPAAVREKIPSLFNDDGELLVQLNGFHVDLANRQVLLGSVTLNPPSPLAFELGSVEMALSSMTFSASSAQIDGSVALTGVGLPISDIPFTALQLGRNGFSGEIDLVGLSGNLSVTILEGEYGFTLDLTQLSVMVDTQLALADMVQLTSFAGSLRFGSGFNNLTIPDLTLLADKTIHWGKNLAAGIEDSAQRLVLSGGLFSLGNLGGSISLENRSLSLSGTLILPPSMGSATITIPTDHPLTLSAETGLSTAGPIEFNPADLPDISLAHIASRLTALSVDIANGNIVGSLAGDLTFEQFGGLEIAVAAAIDKTGLQDLSIDSGALHKTFDLKGFAILTLDNISSGYKNGNFYVEIDGGIQATHALFADYKKKVSLRGLRIFKSGIAFAQNMAGWNDIKGGNVQINAVNLALEQYGLGVDGGRLWFGLKGSANYQDNQMSLTARIFQDGTYKISDFGFDGLTLALGDFSLRSTAQMVAGKLSGEGFINAGFLMPYLPRDLKDPLTGELKVSFSDLGVDLDGRRITSGTVTVAFPRGMNVDLPGLQAQLRSISFGFDGASVDGLVSFATISGIEMPNALQNLNFSDINLTPSGFKGTVSWPSVAVGSGGNKSSQGKRGVSLESGSAGGPQAQIITIPVVTGEYGIALRLSRVELRIDTTKASVMEMIRLTDLDGAVKLGAGYGVANEVTDLRMLADGAITWGVQSLSEVKESLADRADGEFEQGKAQLKEVATDAAAGFSFTIPGTSFAVKNLAGSLSLDDRNVSLWGKIKLPSDLGGGSIRLSRDNSLVLSTTGISTRGPVDIDPGTLGRFQLAGFSADVSAFSFGLSANSVSGSIAAVLKLSAFDNIPIAVATAFNSRGISEMTIATDRLQQSFDIGDFAKINLSKVAGGYTDGEFFVILDADLTLENSAVSDLDRSFSFTGLKVFKDALELADASTGMQEITGATVNLNDAMLMSLTQYGFGVTDSRFWIALSGGVTFGGQEVTATARVYHDGEFVLDQLGGSLLIAVGDFSLRTTFDYSGGMITEATGGLNLGSLMASIPDELKDPLGDLPVTIRNVEIDLSDPSHPQVKSGSIAFNGSFPVVTDFFTAQIDGVEVGAVNNTAYGKVLGGTITFNQTSSLPALEGVSLTNIGLSGSGFSGDLNWNGDATAHVFEDSSYGIDAQLTSLTIGFDSSKTTLQEIIRLKGLVGSLVFGSGYGTSITPAIGYDSVNDLYTFTAGAESALNIPGTTVKLKGIEGSFDFGAANVVLGGNIVFPYESTEIAFAVNELMFSASGVAGSVALENPVDIQGLGFPTVLTQASLAFSGFSISSGSLGLDLTLEQFFDLQVAAALTVDNGGISAWSLGGETDANFTADAGFAELTVSDLGAGYDSSDGLYFSMNTDITMKADAVLSAMPDDMSLSGLQIYATKIEVDAAEMSRSFNGVTVSLAGLDLTLTQLGIGYNNKFYLLAGGNVNIADLCQAGAVIKLFDDLTYELNEIDIEFRNPGFEFEGTLAMYSDDPVYGTGFGAALDVLIAKTMSLEGALQIGSVDTDDASFAYWRVAMKSSATIPMSPIPMNIYGIGGGIAYHMTVATAASGVTFVPDGNTTIALTALLDLGTLDNAYTYFGKFSLTMEPTNYRVVLHGDSWFMKGRGASGEAQLGATIEIGASPAMLHVQAQAKLSKEITGFTLLGVDGQVDLLFAESDWHIYFGSQSQRIEVTALEFLTGSGYIQLDSSGIAMGVKYDFDLEGSAWIFYGRLYGGAQIDLAAGIKPFYIDARGKLWIGLEAGVKARGKKFEIMSAYAELDARFKASEAAGVYIGVHGLMEYSFLMGLVEGTWEITFTMPDDPPEGAGDSSIENIPLVAYSAPENSATGIGRLDSISVRANMPIMRQFRYDDGQWYILCVKDPTQSNDIIDFNDARESAKALTLRAGNTPVEIVGGRKGQMELVFTPFMALSAAKTYTYSLEFQLRHYRHGSGEIGGVVRSEVVTHVFTTTSEELSFRERIYAVYPTRATKPVYKNTPIYLITKAVFDGYIWNWALNSEGLRFEVTNAAGELIPGSVSGKVMVTDGEEGSRRYLLNFTPEQPLQSVRMVEDEAGVKRKALILDDGSFWNPFKDVPAGRHLAGEEMESPVGVGSGLSPQASTARTALVQSGGARTVVAAAAGGQREIPTAQAERHLASESVGLSSVTSKVGAIAGTVAAEYDSHYRWYWDGEYRIRIVDREGNKKYTSKFNLTVPAEGSAEVEYASSQEVIDAGILNPRFHVNFTLDQDAYKADVQRGREAVLYAGINNVLWPMFRSSHYASTAPECRYRAPSDIPELTEAVGVGIGDTMTWDVVDSLPDMMKAFLRRAAMETCAPLAERITGYDHAFDQYKQAAFQRNPSAEFRSLEFRFSTAAPINWNEVEAIVNFEPHADGEVALMGQQIDYGYNTRNKFERGDYILRSQSGSQDHVLELKDKVDGYFDGKRFLQIFGIHKMYNIHLIKTGWANLYSRTLQEGATSLDPYSGEYSLERGTLIGGTGWINTLTPTTLFQ